MAALNYSPAAPNYIPFTKKYDAQIDDMCQDENEFTFDSFVKVLEEELTFDNVASWLGLCPNGDSQCPSHKPACFTDVCGNRLDNIPICTKNHHYKSRKCNEGLCSECNSISDCPFNEYCSRKKDV
jgi:hypothetical protein